MLIQLHWFSTIAEFHFILSFDEFGIQQIGVFYGNPEVTSGGIALKFFASVRLEIRPIGKIKSVRSIMLYLIFPES